MKWYSVKKTIEKIENEEIILDFLEDLSDRARIEYLRTIAEFCQITEKTPLELRTIAKKEQDNNTAPSQLSLKDWLKNYETHSENYNRSIVTYKFRVSIIKSFFNEDDIHMPKERHKRRKNKKKKFKSKNKRKPLTQEQIREVLNNCRKQREKAMILTQCSSGLSVIDLVHLTLEKFHDGLIDVGQGRQICQLHFEEGRSKTEIDETEFYTFISFEGVEAIKRYLNHERNPQFKTKYLFTHHREDQRISTSSYQTDLRNINYRMGLEKEEGKFHEITSHMFRKFFNTQLANTEMGYEARKTMMGHVIPGVDDNYYLGHPDDLQKLYLKYLPVLLINEYESVNIITVDDKIAEFEEKYDRSEELREEERKRYLEKEKEWDEYKRQKEKESEEFREFMEHVKRNKEL